MKGIGPYARGTILPFNRACFRFQRGSPHPSRAAPGPPSPEGKATSRRGLQYRGQKKGQRRKSLAQKALWDQLLVESSGAGTGDAAKDHKVGNGGAAQTVGAVDASGDLTGSEQAGDD